MPAEAFTWATADGTSTFAVGETFESARSMCASTAYESSIDKNVATKGGCYIYSTKLPTSAYAGSFTVVSW